MAKKIFINGFGRIGRTFFRALQKRMGSADLEIVGINDLIDTKLMAYLLKHDSAFGPFLYDVKGEEGKLIVGDKEIPVTSEKDPANLPHSKMEVDIVLESTGFFRKREGAAKHLEAGANKVLISAPATDPDVTIVYKVNHEACKPEHKIVSNASCTTNCLAPVAKVLYDNFTIKRGLMTTIHAVTNDQRVLDAPHKYYTRARASCFNLIPTTTGAAKAIGLVIPDLAGKLDGMAVRAPVITGSIVDLTVEVEKPAENAEQINDLMRKYAEGDMKGVLGVIEDPIVSSDIIENPLSSIFDPHYTKVIDGNFIKVLSWYDNETGYSNRCIDVIDKVM
ncbi:MAG: type I glyceraldehyde-3-phosphate dehydrogenase [Promethearchaeota archaeon]